MKKKCPVSYETLGIQADLKPRDYIDHLRKRIEFLESMLTVGAPTRVTNAQIAECERMIKWIEASARGDANEII